MIDKEIQTTVNYFHKTEERLLMMEDSGLTLEEVLLSREGMVTYFDDAEEYSKEKRQFESWVKEKDYKIVLFLKTINGRIAIVCTEEK